MSVYELEVLEDTPEEVRVALAGELDLTNARELEERLASTVSNGSKLVVDLNRVVFIDSAALHVLFRLARTLGPSALTVLVEPTAGVARTLEIVGVPDAMRVLSSPEDANDVSA
jgi:anti-anti-sigma factor